MKTYEFFVYDADDLWGSMRIKAASERIARKMVRKQLLENEVPSRVGDQGGSLGVPFRLILSTPKSRRAS